MDNQQQFCTGGNTGTGCSVGYGQATAYAVNLNPGNHAIILKDANGNQVTIPSSNIGVNSGFKYSIILTGELHPSYSSSPTLQIVTTTEQPYNTPSGGAAVNVHYASPYVQATNPGSVQFGYTLNNTATANTLGQPIGFGTETTPQGLPNTALNAPISFFAISPTSGITATPNAFSTKCSTNTFPCDTGNLSLYLVDGPAASTSPVAGPYPSGVSASTHAFFIGAFDNNG
jgi:hypothetical protein